MARSFRRAWPWLTGRPARRPSPVDAAPAAAESPAPDRADRWRWWPWRRWGLLAAAFLFALAAQHNFTKGTAYFEDAAILGVLSLLSLVALEWRRAVAVPGLKPLTETQTVAVLGIAGLALALRLVELDRLPGEMWGDAIEHEKMALQAQQGLLSLAYHFGGDGPLFSYLVAGMSRFFGVSFFALKLATAIAGTLLTVATFFLARELFDDEEVAYLAAFVSAVSFWSLSWSRQAKPHILVPLFIALALLASLSGRRILAGVALGLGFYTQAGFWGAALIPLGGVGTYVAAALVVLPLRASLADQFTGTNGFFTEKLGGPAVGPLDFVGRVLENVWKNALSFNVKGDGVFRHNVPNQPHLDPLSGVCFLAGMALILWLMVRRRDRRLLTAFLIPFAVVQIPSVMDVANPGSIPNMGRMIGLLPFVYIAVAYGLHRFARWLPDRTFGNAAIVACLGWIALTNANSLFVRLPAGLPEGNTPFGRTIAETLSDLPANTHTFLIGCCWGGYGQPEPFGIQFHLPERQRDLFRHIDNTGEKLTCNLLRQTAKSEHVYFVLTPRQPEAQAALAQVSECVTPTDTRTLRRNGYDVATLVDAQLRR